MLTQEELDQIIEALKNEGIDFNALRAVQTLAGVNSLPAILGSELVEVPMELLAKPAIDAATNAKKVTEQSTQAIEEVKTASTKAINDTKTTAGEAIALAQTTATNEIKKVSESATATVNQAASTAKEEAHTAATAATTAAGAANTATGEINKMMPNLITNDGPEQAGLAAALASTLLQVNALQKIVAGMLGGTVTFKVLSVDDLRCNEKNNIVSFGEGAPADAPYDKGRLFVDVKNDIIYKSIKNDSPSGWSNK